MKPIRCLLDRYVCTLLRHVLFVCTHIYYTLFYNVGCTNKHLLTDIPGALILATHVSRHDGPLLCSVFYTSVPVRPAVYYAEYHHWAQRLPLLIANAIPLSFPKSWSQEKRAEQTRRSLKTMNKVISNKKAILLFPSGHIRTGAREEIKPYLRGAYDILRTTPQCPIVIVRTQGLGKNQRAIYDGFWSFLGFKKGRRHVSFAVDVLKSPPDPHQPLEAFNRNLENLLNTPVDQPLS